LPDVAAFVECDQRCADLLGGVYEYMTDDGTSRMLRLAWFVKAVVVAAGLCRRIVYSA
jgi:hypothetical protein